jgi:hypothetical protein
MMKFSMFAASVESFPSILLKNISRRNRLRAGACPLFRVIRIHAASHSNKKGEIDEWSNAEI